MRTVSLACIVEEYGEVQALPILIRRIVAELDPNVRVYIPQPVARVSRSGFVQRGELEREIERATRKNGTSGAILVLLDADDDCPATLAPRLLQRARAARSDMPIAVVLAQREYEAWFIAAAASLRGLQGLSDTLTPPANPEEITGAKEWLRKNMLRNRKYDPPLDQPELTRHFDLQSALVCRSFDKLYRDVARLLAELEPPRPERETSPSASFPPLLE